MSASQLFILSKKLRGVRAAGSCTFQHEPVQTSCCAGVVSTAHQVILGTEQSRCLTLFGSAWLVDDTRQEEKEEEEKQLRKYPEKKAGNHITSL